MLPYDTIHIAGTNGKGSVAWRIAAAYQAAGYRTGLFTSPHMLIGLFVYLLATVLWMYLLGEYDYSYIYPMISLVYVFGFAYSKFVFREEINLYRWIGVAMIIAGVIVVNRKG